MTLLIFFAFMGGFVTILSPCILPLLPIVLSTSTQEGKKRPLGVITGFIASFTFFTLFLSGIVRATGISADALRTLAALVILSFGLIMVIPSLQAWWEQVASRLASRSTNNQDKHGFRGGLTVGVSLGLVWTPCVGPILASIITIAATATVTLDAILITLAYALGTAIPMFGLIYTSNYANRTLPFLKKNSRKIQQIFGILMILTALAIHFGYDRRFQAYILEKFPAYGAGLTQLEDTKAVQEELQELKQNKEGSVNNIRKKINDLTNPLAPELIGGGEWINLPAQAGSKPLTLEKLRGKVVLIDFWTYSCINCIRTMPYLRAWHDKYADQGLVIIGVHSPEFEFEKSLDNLQAAVTDFKLEYPIVQDNDFNIWKAYDNNYWPAKYLIDHEGRIQYTHFGEGSYDKTEAKIRELLEIAGSNPEDSIVNIPEYKHQTNTPEIYLGYWRIAKFASPEGMIKDTVFSYSSPTSLLSSYFAYSGSWNIGYQRSAASSGSKITLNFDAKEVYLVMRPTSDSPTATILLDGKSPGSEAGSDVQNGIITLDKDRLYTILELDKPGKHTLTIEFPDGNVEVFAFTFG